jgi:large subunit ribosomal protein L9
MATVEVLLREDVEHLGHRGQIVRVKTGFARNYLLPRKLAILATSSNVNALEQERAALQKREVRERHVAQSLAERLSQVTLEFERKASEQGIFYGSVTVHDIAHALTEQGLAIERRKLHLESPIKQPGDYSVAAKLHRDVVITIPVVVRAEGAAETAGPVTPPEAVAAEAPPMGEAVEATVDEAAVEQNESESSGVV